MKSILTILVAFFTLNNAAFANNKSECMIKQMNAASFELAQASGVLVQNVYILEYQHGLWTDVMSNATGSDNVLVKAGSIDLKKFFIKKYTISAQQMGTSSDCEITDIKEVTLD